MSGYLDQLKQQVEQQKERERATKRQRQQQQIILEKELKPAIQKLHHYLYDVYLPASGLYQQ